MLRIFLKLNFILTQIHCSDLIVLFGFSNIYIYIYCNSLKFKIRFQCELDMVLHWPEYANKTNKESCFTEVNIEISNSSATLTLTPTNSFADDNKDQGFLWSHYICQTEPGAVWSGCEWIHWHRFHPNESHEVKGLFYLQCLPPGQNCDECWVVQT